MYKETKSQYYKIFMKCTHVNYEIYFRFILHRENITQNLYELWFSSLCASELIQTLKASVIITHVTNEAVKTTIFSMSGSVIW